VSLSDCESRQLGKHHVCFILCKSIKELIGFLI